MRGDFPANFRQFNVELAPPARAFGRTEGKRKSPNGAIRSQIHAAESLTSAFTQRNLISLRYYRGDWVATTKARTPEFFSPRDPDRSLRFIQALCGRLSCELCERDRGGFGDGTCDARRDGLCHRAAQYRPDVVRFQLNLQHAGHDCHFDQPESRRFDGGIPASVAVARQLSTRSSIRATTIRRLFRTLPSTSRIRARFARKRDLQLCRWARNHQDEQCRIIALHPDSAHAHSDAGQQRTVRRQSSVGGVQRRQPRLWGQQRLAVDLSTSPIDSRKPRQVPGPWQSRPPHEWQRSDVHGDGDPPPVGESTR